MVVQPVLICSDGSYQLGLPPLSRTLSSSSDDRPGRPKESAAARIRRLKAELAEVEKEVSSDVGSGSGSGSGLGKAGPPTHVSEELHNTAAGSGDTQQDASRVNKSSTNGLPKRRSVLPPRQSMDVMGEVVKLQEWLARVDTLGMDNGIGAGADTVGAGGGADVWRYRLGNLGGASAGMGAQDEGEGAYATKAGEAEDGTEGTGSSLAEIDRRMAGLEKLVGDSADGSEVRGLVLHPSIRELQGMIIRWDRWEAEIRRTRHLASARSSCCITIVRDLMI